MKRKSVSRRADSRQQSAANTQNQKQSNLTKKHLAGGEVYRSVYGDSYGRTADQFVGWIRSDSDNPPQTER